MRAIVGVTGGNVACHEGADAVEIEGHGERASTGAVAGCVTAVGTDGWPTGAGAGRLG